MIDIDKQVAYWRDGSREDWEADYRKSACRVGTCAGGVRMVDATIVNSISKYLQACRENGIDVSFGVIFGSQVQGTAHKWSDIDLLVVSPLFDGVRNRQEVNLLWRIAARVDSRIEPIACGEWQWEHDDVSTIIEVARREGVRVDVPEETPVAKT